MSLRSVMVVDDYRVEDRDLLIFPFLNGKDELFIKKDIPTELKVLLEVPKDAGGVSVTYAGKMGKCRAQIMAVRLDSPWCSSEQAMKNRVAEFLEKAETEHFNRVVMLLDKAPERLVLAAFEGFMLGGYRFNEYLSNPKEAAAGVIVTGEKSPATLRQEIAKRIVLYTQTNAARNLLNEPPNVMKPLILAEDLKESGEKAGLTVTIWDEERLMEERCGGIAAVGMGSLYKPRLVIAEYNPPKAKMHVCLVGKGVTFDTGGYGIKPSDLMYGMKYDMAGAVTVFAAAQTAALQKLPIRLTVIAPLAENMISGEAYQPSAIITTRSGRTVEVDHTDAEGRLLLADALAIAAEKKPDLIIDFATLTRAISIALGEDIAGIYGTDRDLVRQFIEAAASEGENFWEMPLHMPYSDQIRTPMADCKNRGGKYGGSIIGAIFLKQWVPDEIKWIHCDILGPGAKEEPLGHLGRGAKGFGVKGLYAFLEELSRNGGPK